jgi:selenocysteine lyase/cysteine desulfurase
VYDGTPLAPFADLLAREFPRRAEGVFLNTAAQGILPRRAIDAMAAFERGRQYPNRIDDPALQEVEETCRARIANLVGAPAERVGLGLNTSEGLNLAALQIPLEPGDRVLPQRRDFPANVLPWVARRAEGEVVWLDPDDDGHLGAERVVAALDRDSRIRVVALPLVHFATGHRHPIEAIAEACRSRDVWLVVDGIQGIGAVPFDAIRAGADLVACGGQKWLCAPWGAGFFVVSERLLATTPARAGWLQVARARAGAGEYGDLCDYRLGWPDDAARFEVGTYPYTALLGLSESVGLLFEIGVERIHAHARSLLDRVAAFVEERGGRVASCRRPACRSGILCFRLDESESTRVLHRRLLEAGVACAYREGSIRLAAHLYNTPSEIDRVVEALAAAWPAVAGVA